MQVTIAAQACLLVLGLDHEYYRRVRTILVYPTRYKDRNRSMSHWGTVTEGDVVCLGETRDRGPVVLAWDTVWRRSQNRKSVGNVVYHEFAHQLDLLDDLVDGTPPLATATARNQWVKVMTAEFAQLRDSVAGGLVTLLDDYGATNVGEFFAVATECFSQKSAQLQQRHLRLYEVLRDVYRQYPASRLDKPDR